MIIDYLNSYENWFMLKKMMNEKNYRIFFCGNDKIYCHKGNM